MCITFFRWLIASPTWPSLMHTSPNCWMSTHKPSSMVHQQVDDALVNGRSHSEHVNLENDSAALNCTIDSLSNFHDLISCNGMRTHPPFRIASLEKIIGHLYQ